MSGYLPLAAFGCMLLLRICPDAERQDLSDELLSLNRLTTKLEMNEALTEEEGEFLKEAGLHGLVSIYQEP